MSLFRRLFGISITQGNQTEPSKSPPLVEKKAVIDDCAVCPYCGVSLAVKPARKKKCPSCLQSIFVIDGVLLTQEQADSKRALKRLAMFDVTAGEFERVKGNLRKEFGADPSTNDVIWRILNSLITRAKADENLKMVYYEMANIAKREGKDPRPYQTQAIRQDLLSYKRMGVKRVQVFGISDNSTCEYCKRFANKTMSLEKALKEMPLPGSCSSPDGCRCMYSPVISD